MITPSAAITIVALLVIFIRAKSSERFFLACLTVLISLSVNAFTATAFQIGGQEINCDDIVLAVCFMSALSLLVKGLLISKKQIIFVAILFGVIVLGFLSSVAFSGSIQIILPDQSWDDFYYGYAIPGYLALSPRCMLVFVRVAIFCVLLLVAQAVLNESKILEIAKAVLLFSTLHVLFSLFELVDKTVIQSNIFVTISQTLFNPVFSHSVIRGDFVALWGITREPSHFAYAMFFTALICVLLSVTRGLNHRELFTGVVAAILMLVSGAFSGVVLAVGLLLFFAIAMARRSRLRRLGNAIDARFVLAAMGVILLLIAVIPFAAGGESYYASKFSNVINNISDLVARRYSSIQGSPDAMPRMISIVETTYLFLRFPLFGSGLGTVNPFSALVGIIATVGLFGLAAWLAIVADYTKSLSGPKSVRLVILLFLAIGAINLDASLMYNPVWLLLCGLLRNPCLINKRNVRMGDERRHGNGRRFVSL